MKKTLIKKVRTIHAITTNGRFDSALNKSLQDGWEMLGTIQYFETSDVSGVGIFGTVAVTKTVVEETADTEESLRQYFGDPWFNWFSRYLSLLPEVRAKWTCIRELYMSFLTESNLSQNDYSIKKFRSGMERSAMVYGYSLLSRRNSSIPGNKTQVRTTVTR